eukprot:m.10620 g.10620  ORF g.10620 m.10620 type:complete len:303 (-) comp7453_c0_seq1:50-958(-)
MATDWEKIAHQREAELAELRHELEDFEESSRMLEQELENELKQNQTKLKQEETQRRKYQRLYEEAKEKFAATEKELRKENKILEGQVTKLKQQCEQATSKVRELELTNDEFERNARQVSSTLESVEERANQTIEQNALLQTDLEEHQNTIQHLKEEIRDLQAELEVLRQRPDPATFNGHAVSSPSANNDIPQMQINGLAQTPSSPSLEPPSPDSTLHAQPETPAHSATKSAAMSPSLPITTPSPSARFRNSVASPLTPSPSRGVALSFVTDLLQRVSNLENKLTTCRASLQDSDHAQMPVVS